MTYKALLLVFVLSLDLKKKKKQHFIFYKMYGGECTLQKQQISTDYHCGHQGPEARSLQKIKKFMQHIHYPDGRKIPYYSYYTIS
jgi:hypothetical protein